MDKNIPDVIIESIRHFHKRAKAAIEHDVLIEELEKLEKIDFDDLKNIETKAKSYIELAQLKYKAGLVSEQEYIFHQYHSVVSLVHETRWLQGVYSDQLDPISKKMRAVEKSYGLTDDEYWKRGDAPPEYQVLDEEYNAILDSKLRSEFLEFASEDVAEMFSDNRDKHDSLSEVGRKSIFVNDEVERLSVLASLYESEAEADEAASSFYSASIMLAAAMESRLIIQCIENRNEVRETLLKMGLSNSKLKSKNPLDWKLNTLLEVCAVSGWLPNVETDDFVFSSKNIGHTLRNTRNLVHPGMHVKRKSALAVGREQYKDMKAAHSLVSELLKHLNTKHGSESN